MVLGSFLPMDQHSLIQPVAQEPEAVAPPGPGPHGGAAQSFAALLVRLSDDPGDNDDLRLQKRILVGGSFAGIASSIVWSAIYLAINEPLAALLTVACYAGGMALGLVVYSRTRDYVWYRTLLFGLLLFTPFLLVLAMGGLVNSGGVILWAFFSPLGATAFCSARQALAWFVGFVSLVTASVLLPVAWIAGHDRPLDVVLALFVLNIVGSSTTPFATLRYFVLQRDTALRLLRIEREKSESLLLSILPPEIAAVLRNESRTIADQYEETTILFADVVNFTPLATILTPTQAVELLNEIFSHFDSLVERYDLEKIKTIGDGYMVAAGVPRPRPDHAQAVAHLALDMLAYIHSRANPQGVERATLDIRIGINSGSVVAGVIGHKKFLYDLWGDTVNTASRMESHGLPGTIQLTEATHALIKDTFICERRGVILVKGKGEMETWVLVGPKPDA
jgi:adenylate cyclase